MGLTCEPLKKVSRTIGLSLENTFISLTNNKLHFQDNYNKFRELFVKRTDEIMVDITFLFDPEKILLKKKREYIDIDKRTGLNY